MTRDEAIEANGDHLPEVVGKNPPNGISVLVVGSGIGGLSAARELWRIGCDVRVFERQPHELLTGDSFAIGPSAISSLSKFPRLQKETEDIKWSPLMYLHDIKGSLVKGPLESKDLLSPAAKKLPNHNLDRYTRPRLYKTMMSHLRRVGVPIDHGKEVVDYFEGGAAGRAGVILKDGSRHEADLVIAAEGVYSHSWKIVLGHEVPARPSGDAVFRVSMPVETALKDPVIDAEFPLAEGDRSTLYLYFGTDVQVIVSRNTENMDWALVHPDDGRAKESWDHHPPVEKALELLQEYKELPDPVRRVMRATPPNMLVDYRVMWRDPQPKWTSPKGRILQLGDAAHTFHPSSGNGGTQAIEDAVSLAKCLSIAGKENIEWATRVSSLLRFERVSCLQAFGIFNQASRGKGPTIAEFGRWILGHDPEAYAAEKYEEALSHLRNGTPFQNTNTPPGMVYSPWSIDTVMEKVENGEPTVLSGDWS